MKDHFSIYVYISYGNRLGKCGPDLRGSGLGTVAGSCKQSNKILGSEKRREIFSLNE
jgi:hypothetical protein